MGKTCYQDTKPRLILYGALQDFDLLTFPLQKSYYFMKTLMRIR